jgi:hypothetical protein
MNRKVTKALFLFLLSSSFLLGSTSVANAETIDHCRSRIVQAEHNLHYAIRRYGRNSRRAAYRRTQLHNARERCWRERHRWWDEHSHRWHKAHDWDDRDHD